MTDISTHKQPPAVAYIAMATGWLAVGALAVGAIAIGSMAIGALAIKKVKLRDVEIENLTVRRLRVLETHPPQPEIRPADTQGATPEPNGEGAPRAAPRRRRPRKPMPN
jgi:hypothetical protein